MARQTKCPEEFVKLIYLVLPLHEAEIDNPVEDAAFMALIDAKLLDCTFWLIDDSPEYELKNAVNGMRFTFTCDHLLFVLTKDDL